MAHYIIDFVDNATEEAINAYLNTCGATLIKTFSAFEKVVLVECLTEPPASEIVEHIKDDEDHTQHVKLLTTINMELPVLPTEGSKTVNLSEQKDWWKVYSGSSVDFDAESFQLPLSGKGSVVYLLDSGIKSDHPDFEDADIEYLYSLTEDFTDRKGHGTALASLIVGKTCGITNTKLKVVKLFDTEVPTKLSDFLSALDAVYADFSAVNMYGVINCSWEIARNEYVESKLQKLWLAGLQIVTAAGNTGTDIGNVTPAAMPEAIVVGAYNAALTPCDFSDYTGSSATAVTPNSVNGGALSGWAPGENIYVATLNGEYGFSSGTSMSAAIHSAILAYNVSLPAFQSHVDINTMFNVSTINRLTFFLKKDLLILDDVKYENSPNLVSSLINDATESYYTTGAIVQLFTALHTKVLSRGMIVNPLNVASLTVHGELPYNIKINQHGILSGYVEEITGDKEEYTVPVTVTYTSGESVDTELKIMIMVSKKEVTPTDPKQVIPYTLNANCYEFNLCPGTCDNYGCGAGYCTCSKGICDCTS
jgi:hypothetical protein